MLNLRGVPSRELTNILSKGSWEDEFSFPLVGNLSSVEGIV